MPQYVLITSTGTTPPRYIHNSIESAQNEAIRLCNQFNCSVKILEVVAHVFKKEVPVTEIKPVVEFVKNSDDLPF